MTVTSPRTVETAEAFHALHHADDVLCLANAWDVPTARLIEAAGATAIATTSAGVAWSLGTADGDHVDRAAAIDRVSAIVTATGVPVSADIESGFAADAEGVGETVRQVIAAGAVGINIEDATHDGREPLRDPDDQARRIDAARQAATDAGLPLYINARTDTYLLAVGPEAGRLAETLDRAAAFLAAGADGVFVPGVTGPETIGALVEGIDAPLNILVGSGAPSVAELGRLGVARASLGSSLALAAYALVRRGASELFDSGTYSSLRDELPYGEINDLMSR
jgi:2-methylisocitrate lyase-like PEP mutase family enzyme